MFVKHRWCTNENYAKRLRFSSGHIFYHHCSDYGDYGIVYSIYACPRCNNIQNREQAMLLAQSATELAVLAMQRHQYLTSELMDEHKTAANFPTLNTIRLAYPSNNAGERMFDITVTFGYFDRQLGAPGDNTVAYSNFGQASTAVRPSGVTGAVLSHAALVDVIVESNTAVMGTPKVRYHRRTIQKP